MSKYLYEIYYGYLKTLWGAGLMTFKEFDRAVQRLNKLEVKDD